MNSDKLYLIFPQIFTQQVAWYIISKQMNKIKLEKITPMTEVGTYNNKRWRISKIFCENFPIYNLFARWYGTNQNRNDTETTEFSANSFHHQLLYQQEIKVNLGTRTSAISLLQVSTTKNVIKKKVKSS